MINKEKLAIMFSPNTSTKDKREVMQALNIRRETVNERYQGLLVHVGKSRKKVFTYLKERIWARIQGWKEKMLSNAGKEILVKVVAQAIPTFAMGCFDITKELCDEINSMICKYWWSNMEKENKMHWINWSKLTDPNEEGGLGFRDTKQGWRLL